jgi:hypothetical protein
LFIRGRKFGCTTLLEIVGRDFVKRNFGVRNFAAVLFYIFPKKIYRLKEDQAFLLSLELGRREKVVRQPSGDFLPLPPMESSPQPVPQFV